MIPIISAIRFAYLENDFQRKKWENALSDSLKFSSSSMAENYSELYKKVVKLGAARNGKE